MFKYIKSLNLNTLINYLLWWLLKGVFLITSDIKSSLPISV